MRSVKSALRIPLLAVILLSLLTAGSPRDLRSGRELTLWDNDGANNWIPQAAYNPQDHEYLVVWINEHTAGSDIYARRVGENGEIRSWFTVVSAPAVTYLSPVVAYSSTNRQYLVVYVYYAGSGNYDIYGVLVSASGASIGSPFAIIQDVEAQESPAVAYNSANDEFLVAYHNDWAGGLADIAAQRLRADNGQKLSWRNLASGAGTRRTDPAVAYDPTNNRYLVAYTYRPGDIWTNGDIRSVIVHANMSTVSGEQTIASQTESEEWPAVSTGGGEYLIAWTRRFTNLTRDEIYARRMNLSGGLISPAPILVAGGDGYQISPAVAWANGQSIIVWRDDLNAPPAWEVWGRTMAPGSDANLSTPFLISNGPSFDSGVNLACTTRPTGPCLAAYENYNAAQTEMDIFARTLIPHWSFLPDIHTGQ